MKEESLKRSGFSLIELVFSIVIIAISLMSVPMLISESDKGNQYSLIQESVMAARTKLGNILTYQWDDQSTIINGGATEGLRIIDTNGFAELNRVNPIANPEYRIGARQDPNRRKFDQILNTVLATAIGSEFGEAGNTFDDIDDFDGTQAQLISSNANGIKNGNNDYLGASELNISTTVNFLTVTPVAIGGANTYQGLGARTINTVFDVTITTDGTAAQSTNIKMIELSVANAFSDEPFIFRAFSSNIGGNKALHSEVK